ncbi:MAG: HAD family hydrolase [Candidatus Marinimicrobia bacterium]|nr:HAD family hydrolase [Candidatus Neomarinimicrobiota bacterium]
MIEGKEALLIDMNSTFMFGEDRFGEDEDFSEYYRSIGGALPDLVVNEVIRNSYDYLDEKYPKEAYRHTFPSLEFAIEASSGLNISKAEKDKIIKTFSFHEHGEIPPEYVSALKSLKEKYKLALVIDIWAPKAMWVKTFKSLGIWNLFSAHSFSSDHGMVKPSPKPFEMVVDELGVAKEKCLVIGDSIRRDLGGSQAALLDCILVGGAKSDLAVGLYSSLLEFQESVQSCS